MMKKIARNLKSQLGINGTSKNVLRQDAFDDVLAYLSLKKTKEKLKEEK